MSEKDNVWTVFSLEVTDIAIAHNSYAWQPSCHILAKTKGELKRIMKSQ